MPEQTGWAYDPLEDVRHTRRMHEHLLTLGAARIEPPTGWATR
ncbi:hypothetical protein ACFY8B_35680 [Streptomyces sp. NPDC012751]